MNNNNIQQLIDSGANKYIELPLGEFEGTFYIKSPCSISGNHTTLWAENKPVIVVQSKGVSMRNLTIETTGNQAVPSFISNKNDVRIENVEIWGDVQGIELENGHFEIPRIIQIGEFPSEEVCTFKFEIDIPADATVKSFIKNISVFPEKLLKGKNIITIQTEKIKENTYIYGNIYFNSIFKRKIYITGVAKNHTENYTPNKIFYKIDKQNNTDAAKNNTDAYKQKVEYEKITPIAFDSSISILQKGERLPCSSSKYKIQFFCEEKPKIMDIDTYIFMLDKSLKAPDDSHLIFYGNKSSKDGSIKVIDNIAEINLDSVSNNIERISVCYAIYTEENSLNFSYVKGITINLNSDKNLVIKPEGLSIEAAFIAFDFYRYKGIWKIHTISAGYKDGIRKLIENFGLEVI